MYGNEYANEHVCMYACACACACACVCVCVSISNYVARDTTLLYLSGTRRSAW